MPIVLVIIGLIALYVLWDYIIYLIGGLFILLALALVVGAYSAHNEASIPPDEWKKRSDKKQAERSTAIVLLVAALISGGIGYKIIDYNSNRIAISEQEEKDNAQKKEEELNKKIEQLSPDGKEVYNKKYQELLKDGKTDKEAKSIAYKEAETYQTKIANINKKINELDSELKILFDEKYQVYLAEGLKDNDAKERALKDIEDKIKAEKEEEDKQAKAQEEEQKKLAKAKENPYYDYRNADKGLVGYMLWYTIDKTPNVTNLYKERKATLPYDELISSAELEKLEYRNVAFVKNTIYPDRYEMRDNGNILFHGHTSLEIPVISKIPGELTPAGWGILAKKLPDGTMAPIYIGYLGQGTFEAYGILYDTIKVNDKYVTYIKYEGNFEGHKYSGVGNLYEIDTNNMENGIPSIKISSGTFSKGAKDGDFVEYDGSKMSRKHYNNGKVSS